MIKKIFYLFKPFIPRSFQIFLRRLIVRRQQKKFKDIWPILRSSGKLPENWLGWPNNKKFAFVLTHDVELQRGHDQCLKLALMEKELGFVSSFNFVPERYNVSAELRNELVKLGFEIGVHGLNHDGKLFSSKKIFDERAKKINKYIKEWNATGFRAPAMHHNLKWIHDLDIKYDLSTFDTDPFEPQSDGVGTIFPFIAEDNNGSKYIEMPYTLVQDFTLFILMQEKNIQVWKNKVDWINEKGGMVLVNVHPDYINYGPGKSKREKFPVKLYIDLLEYIKEKYSNKYWHALPREVAEHILRNQLK